MAVRIDAFGDSVCRHGELLCGNRIEILRQKSGVTAILADGRGGGVRANMLASLAVQMASTLLAQKASVEEIADILVESQPAGREEGVSYAAFTLVQADFSGAVSAAQMETPDLFLLRQGRPVCVRTREKTRGGRLIRLLTADSGAADTLVAVSRGMLRAAEGRDLREGWQPRTICGFLSNAYHPSVTPEKLVSLLLNAGRTLARQKPKDDLSALAFRFE